MKGEKLKVLGAKWLYRWQLAQGIIGALFSALTFAGVFTLLLGPVFQQWGLGYSSVLFFLIAVVVGTVLGFGLVLDRVVQFWKAQTLVGTVRNPFLVDRLYQKELLTIENQHLPVMRALRSLTRDPRITVELDAAIDRLEQTARDKRWTIRPEEEVYDGESR